MCFSSYTLVDARRDDVAAAVTGVDDDRHPAVDLRGAGRLDLIVRLALGCGVVAHADEIVRADVAAGSLGGVHEVRPAVRKAVHDDLCVRGELTDLFRGRGRGSAHRELALDLYAVPAGRERLVGLGLAVIIAQTLEITRADIAARARRGVHQMRPAVRKAVYDDLVALRQLADGRIGGSRAGAHGERGRNIHLIQTGRKNRFRRRGGRRRVRRRAAVVIAVIIVAAVIVIRLFGVRGGRRESDGARGIVPSGLEADRVRDVRDAVIVVVVDQVAAEGDRTAVEQDLEGGRGDLERGEGRGGKLAADLLIFLTGDQIDDRALAGRPGDVEGRGGVAEKIRDVAQLEVVIAVNIIGRGVTVLPFTMNLWSEIATLGEAAAALVSVTLSTAHRAAAILRKCIKTSVSAYREKANGTSVLHEMSNQTYSHNSTMKGGFQCFAAE